MKVKVLRFCLSSNNYAVIYSASEIEKLINDSVVGCNIVSITHEIFHSLDSDLYDMVEIIYTILCEERVRCGLPNDVEYSEYVESA